MITNSVKVNISFAKKAEEDHQIRKDCSDLISDGTPLLAAVKFFLFDERLFQLFASISFPTWERMQTVMIAFFGNTANDNFSTNALKVAQYLSKWVKENQKQNRWNATDNQQCGPLLETHVDAMTQRFAKFVGNDNTHIFHRLSEWGILCLLRSNNEYVHESLALNNLFCDFGELPRTVHELLCKRSQAKGKEKTAFLNDARALLPQMRNVMTTLEEKLKGVFVCEFEDVMEERRVSVLSADMLDGKAHYTEHARLFFQFQYLKDFGFFVQKEDENDNRGQDIRKAIIDSSRHLPAYGDNLRFLCKLNMSSLMAVCVFVEYSRYYFGLLDKKNTTGLDKSDEKMDDAKFLERWSRFAFGSLDPKFLKNIPFSAAGTSKLVALTSSYHSANFNFEHIKKLKSDFKSPERLFFQMNYCVCLSQSLTPLFTLHKKTMKDETRIDIAMAHVSCPTDLKNAQKDLRFISHPLNARFDLYHNRKDLWDLKNFWDVAFECNIFRSMTLEGNKIYMKNILTMMKNAKLVKDEALKKKQDIAQATSPTKKQKRQAKSNQVTITARPKPLLIDGRPKPVTITLNIDGAEKEIPMAGFKMVFVSTPTRDENGNIIDPLVGHVVIYRKFETEVGKKWDTVLFGVINNDGKFLHTKSVKKYVHTTGKWVNGYGDLLTLLRVLDAMPLECSSILAKMTGSCLACGMPMTQEESLKSGFGAVCMKNLGLTKDGVKALVPKGVYQINKNNKVIANAPSFVAQTDEMEMESPSKKLKSQ